MAQFDVFENPNNKTKAIYPYLLDVQNGLLEELETRLVVPISRASNLNHHQFTKLTPEVSFNDEKLLLMVPQGLKPVGFIIVEQDQELDL